MRTLEMAEFDDVLLTRQRAREVARELPPRLGPVRLSFRGVKSASPSFLDELRKAIADAGGQITGVVYANPHIRGNLERLDAAAAAG